MAIDIKRAYKDAEEADGYRVLVDRIWPRGISKQDISIDLWLKQVAPSSDLRKWFNHEQEKFSIFKKSYQKELQEDREKQIALGTLKECMAANERVTLVYGAKDEVYNHAQVLKEVLNQSE